MDTFVIKYNLLKIYLPTYLPTYLCDSSDDRDSSDSSNSRTVVILVKVVTHVAKKY